jgi:hypothetical protein
VAPPSDRAGASRGRCAARGPHCPRRSCGPAAAGLAPRRSAPALAQHAWQTGGATAITPRCPAGSCGTARTGRPHAPAAPGPWGAAGGWPRRPAASKARGRLSPGLGSRAASRSTGCGARRAASRRPAAGTGSRRASPGRGAPPTRRLARRSCAVRCRRATPAWSRISAEGRGGPGRGGDARRLRRPRRPGEVWS